MSLRRVTAIVGMLALGLLALLTPRTPLAAQGSVTPTGGQPSAPSGFATNTPQPVVSLPDAPFERYALRLWDERQLVGVLIRQIQQLGPHDAERRLAIRLVQAELKRRFPNAPRSGELREQLLQTMLNAPRGSVDIRPAIRPYVQLLLNQSKPPFNTASTLNQNGFSVAITPARVNRQSQSALLHTRFPSFVSDPSELRYEEYIPALIDERGIYRVLDAAPAIPAAPFGDVLAVNLQRLEDVNQDGLDELAITVSHRESVNQELIIYGWRNNTLVNLVAPGQKIAVGEIVTWPPGGVQLTAREYRLESSAWNCLGERDVIWSWALNFFRPPNKLSNFTFQSRLACLLYGSEPFFEIGLDEAINKLQTIVPFAAAEDEASVQRANLMIAMLEYLKGDTLLAVAQVKQLQAVSKPGSWLARQTDAFLKVGQQPNITPLQVCAAVERASAYGVCDVNQVLKRLFSDNPPTRGEPLEIQFERLGLKVVNKTTIVAVGRVNRPAFQFDLAGKQWWAFAPLSQDTYTAEAIESPAAFQPTATPGPRTITPPENAYDAFLNDGDAANTLNVLDTTIRANPNVPLTPSARFLQALSYDFLGDRGRARRVYFALWQDAPGTVWGQLAAEHLEKR